MAWDPKDDIYKHFAMTPDQQLLLWEDWIQIREHEVVKLGFRTMRPPADLAMNIIEGIRPDREWKITLDDAQIPIRARLRDSLWEQAARLKQCCPCDNVYEAQRTAAEVNKPKIIEHVVCPDYIQTHEKGLLGEKERIVCSKLDRMYKEYRKEREEKYKDKIKKIDPFRPDMKELIVIGRKPQTPPKKLNLPTITLTPPQNECVGPLSGVFALRINNTIAIKYIPKQNTSVLENMQNEHWHETCTNWTYYFNVAENRIGRAKLFLQNLGTVTLRYCWKKIRKVIPYIPEENDYNFFFNKNEDVIAPGQCKNIYFTFVANGPGIFTQIWELTLMNNILFDTTSDKFSVTLVGDCVEDVKKMTRKIEKFEATLDRNAAYKMVFNLVSNIIMNASDVQHEIYPYKKYFVEAELFVARNMQHFYHQTEVGLLKDSFKHMTGKEWDLSLLTWRNAMMTNEFDERMRYYDQLKKSNRVLLSPWYEGEDLLYEKHRAVKLLLGQLALKFFDEFERVCKWNGVLRKPSHPSPPPFPTPTVSHHKAIASPLPVRPLTKDIVHNIFYMRMYDHVADTMEMIAGIVSSLELNRWIEFDFCQF
ncbi:MYCBP-associated protein family domain-containing protein [Phthorimaea operculella]|nr:MYCBP-associated protein family domain-containing protein [Phthorimaea operculella]